MTAQAKGVDVRISDDDCCVILQDWDPNDPDQAVAIRLANEVISLRAAARSVDKFSLVILSAVRQDDPEMHERVCSAILDLRHAALDSGDGAAKVKSPDDSTVKRAVEAFLASTGQAHTVTQLQRDLTTTCMRAALQALANIGGDDGR